MSRCLNAISGSQLSLEVCRKVPSIHSNELNMEKVSAEPLI